MFTAGDYSDYGANPGTAPQSDFASGNLAFYGTSSGGISSLTALGQENGFPVRVSAPPSAPGTSQPGSVIGGSSLYLSKNLSNASREAALTFIYSLVSGDQSAKLTEQVGYIPVRQSAVDLLQEQGYFEDNPNQQAAVQVLAGTSGSNSSTSSIFGSYKDARPVINRAISSILQGAASPQAAADAATAQIDQQIQEYNILNGRP